jgi:hypothetical protein
VVAAQDLVPQHRPELFGVDEQTPHRLQREQDRQQEQEEDYEKRYEQD